MCERTLMSLLVQFFIEKSIEFVEKIYEKDFFEKMEEMGKFF